MINIVELRLGSNALNLPLLDLPPSLIPLLLQITLSKDGTDGKETEILHFLAFDQPVSRMLSHFGYIRLILPQTVRALSETITPSVWASLWPQRYLAQYLPGRVQIFTPGCRSIERFLHLIHPKTVLTMLLGLHDHEPLRASDDMERVMTTRVRLDQHSVQDC